MCGIAGIFNTRYPTKIDVALLRRMNEMQHHRGPDETGLHTEPGVGLAHKRLSIIDLSSGQQPMFNETQDVVVVFNGEIYNHRELMCELIAAGHVFRTRSDTEVIVHAWEEWGEDCVKRFRGMFAFAIWDREAEVLFLARDRLGVKPLFYSLLPNGQFIFGSELKVLTAHPGVTRQLDTHAIEDYFAYGYVPDPKTIYQNVHKLPAASTLLLRRRMPLPPPKNYWDVNFDVIEGISLEEAQEEFVYQLREAIKIRLVSEVPLGAFLSGGVDSSAVVALMAGLSNEPVNTCSISFGDPAFNESAYAQQVATRYGTRHHVKQVEADDFELIGKLASLYDEPYADSSALPTYRLCQMTRQHVTVALSGDGGDEAFAGYRRYQWHLRDEQMRNVLPATLRRHTLGVLGNLYPPMPWAPRVFRAKSTLQNMGRDSVEAYFDIMAIMKDSMRRQLFSEEFRHGNKGHHPVEVMQKINKRSPARHPLSRVQYLDMKTYLPGDILTKVDRASMAHAVEVREPLLDHQLLEWACRLPVGLKLHNAEGKYVFKKAMEAYVPYDVLYRKKMGFAVPLANWFRGPLKTQIREAVLGETLLQTGYFNPTYLRRLVDDHQCGKHDYCMPLWSLLMFDAFLKHDANLGKNL